MLVSKLIVFLVLGLVSSHSWVEQVSKLDIAGHMIGNVGFPRGNGMRNNIRSKHN